MGKQVAPTWYELAERAMKKTMLRPTDGPFDLMISALLAIQSIAFSQLALLELLDEWNGWRAESEENER